MLIVMLLSLLVPLALQEPPKPSKPPRRGDLVEVRGCLKRGVLETSDLKRQGSEEEYSEFATFRLTGDKKVLDEIRKEHDGHADIVRGELRTDLPKPSDAPGKRVGNTRITVGVSPGGGMASDPVPQLPVLKATSIEHTGASCRPQS